MNVIRKNVTFEQPDFIFVRNYANQKGYGQRGFSAALRHMIRFFMERNQNSSARVSEPEDGQLTIAEPSAGD